VELSRQRLDNLAFMLALAAISAAAAGFASQRNGAAFVMCAICAAGLVAGRLAGISGGVTLAVALGLVAILWIVWVDPLSTPRRTNVVAHSAGGARAAMIGVLALTVAWELGELAGDRLLDTALIPSRRDSAFDIFFGCLGGAAGIVVARMLAAIDRPARRMG
jgi:hypothetical protein